LKKEALEYSLIENLQRKDVDPLDIAKALKKLYDIVCHGDTKLSCIFFMRSLRTV
jgi:translation initiation factor 1 (eIF-1/SUI1)